MFKSLAVPREPHAAAGLSRSPLGVGAPSHALGPEPTMTALALTELILSATAPASPISTTQLHSITTASLVFSFKSSNQPTSTSAPGQDEQSSVGHRKSMGYVEASNGCGGFVMALGGKDGRAAVNVWGFQKVRRLRAWAGHGGGADDAWYTGANPAEAHSASSPRDAVRVQHGALRRWRHPGRTHILLGGQSRQHTAQESGTELFWD